MQDTSRNSESFCESKVASIRWKLKKINHLKCHCGCWWATTSTSRVATCGRKRKLAVLANVYLCRRRSNQLHGSVGAIQAELVSSCLGSHCPPWRKRRSGPSRYAHDLRSWRPRFD